MIPKTMALATVSIALVTAAYASPGSVSSRTASISRAGYAIGTPSLASRLGTVPVPRDRLRIPLANDDGSFSVESPSIRLTDGGTAAVSASSDPRGLCGRAGYAFALGIARGPVVERAARLDADGVLVGFDRDVETVGTALCARDGRLLELDALMASGRLGHQGLDSDLSGVVLRYPHVTVENPIRDRPTDPVTYFMENTAWQPEFPELLCRLFGFDRSSGSPSRDTYWPNHEFSGVHMAFLSSRDGHWFIDHAGITTRRTSAVRCAYQPGRSTRFESLTTHGDGTVTIREPRFGSIGGENVRFAPVATSLAGVCQIFGFAAATGNFTTSDFGSAVPLVTMAADARNRGVTTGYSAIRTLDCRE